MYKETKCERKMKQKINKTKLKRISELQRRNKRCGNWKTVMTAMERKRENFKRRVIGL